MEKNIVLLLIISLLLLGFANIYAADYYPGETWRTSTPEAQGMDSDILYQISDLIQSSDLKINSVLIIRHGYLVEELYKYPYSREIRQNLNSGTKSFISALVGIEIKNGNLKDVHQKVCEFFPEIFSNISDEREKAMTVEDLLTMRTGLDWPAFDPYMDIKLNGVQNWVEYILKKGMETDPGKEFSYCNPSPCILSAIIGKTCGMEEKEFADRYLFQPLGIKNYYWPTDPQNNLTGYSGLAVTPRDMARFGYLYLKKGWWNGKQILSEGWVDESSRMHVDFHNTNAQDKYCFSGYGYLFWLSRFGGYMANGAIQYIYVCPEKDMVVVFSTSLSTSGAPNFDEQYIPISMIQDFILKSVLSEKPLPEKPISQARHRVLLEQMINGPEAGAPAKLPSLAIRISGKKILLNGDFIGRGIKAYSFNFNGVNDCTVSQYYKKKTETFRVGMDGRYLVNNQGGSSMVVFSRGKWLNDYTFSLEYCCPVKNTIIEEFNFIFHNKLVLVQYQNKTGNHEFTMTGILNK